MHLTGTRFYLLQYLKTPEGIFYPHQRTFPSSLFETLDEVGGLRIEVSVLAVHVDLFDGICTDDSFNRPVEVRYDDVALFAIHCRFRVFPRIHADFKDTGVAVFFQQGSQIDGFAIVVHAVSRDDFQIFEIVRVPVRVVDAAAVDCDFGVLCVVGNEDMVFAVLEFCVTVLCKNRAV